MRVIVSYRHADVGGYAGRLSDKLVQRLGARNVFQDVTGIGAGRDFVAAIRHALDACDAAVVIIGPGWLSASSPEGRSRLFEADDYVRLELSTALSRDLPVIPVLVGGAALPAETDLPEDIRPILQRQAIVLRDETWHQDVENLLRSLRGKPAAGVPHGRRRLRLAAGTAALLAIIGVARWRPWADGAGAPSGRSGDGASPASPSCPDPTGPDWTRLGLTPNPSVQQQFDDGFLIFTVRAASWRLLEQGRWQLIVDMSVANHRRTSNFGHDDDRYEAIILGQKFRLDCFESSVDTLTPGALGDGRTGWVVSCMPIGRVDLLIQEGPRLTLTDAAEPSPC